MCTEQALGIALDLPLIPFAEGSVYGGYPITDSFLVHTSPDQKESHVDLVWDVLHGLEAECILQAAGKEENMWD